ncbi:hypothetical protein HYV86_01235 [Candidatus Woesearchaeota archaeon]|nr:hypothetical protein [Candidatus Woesearchaeota archaeon]
MLWIDYTQTSIPSSFSDLAHHLEQQYRKVLIEKYCKGKELLYYERAIPALARQLPAVLWALEGNVKNKIIVDLGCGSTVSFDTPSYAYEPWLGRLLHEAGAKVIGIDAHREVLKEEFETECIDLWQAGIGFLKNKRIDLIHAASFFDAPGVTGKGNSDEMKKRIEKELSFYKGTLLYA